jgi:hypothetical protein
VTTKALASRGRMVTVGGAGQQFKASSLDITLRE